MVRQPIFFTYMFFLPHCKSEVQGTMDAEIKSDICFLISADLEILMQLADGPFLQ